MGVLSSPLLRSPHSLPALPAQSHVMLFPNEPRCFDALAEVSGAFFLTRWGYVLAGCSELRRRWSHFTSDL